MPSEEASKRMDDLASSFDCPPGYWCKPKKRQFDSVECSQGLIEALLGGFFMSPV